MSKLQQAATFTISSANLYTASIKELRAFVAEHNITVHGNKREKAPYQVAIACFLEYWQSVEDETFSDPSDDDALSTEIGIAEDVIPFDASQCSDEAAAVLAHLKAVSDANLTSPLAKLEAQLAQLQATVQRADLLAGLA